MGARTFRRQESLDHEKVTRDMIPRFLRSQGLSRVSDHRIRGGQTIRASLPTGLSVDARVKLCWRRDDAGRNQARHSAYSATQLIARIDDGDWIGSITSKIEREARSGTTHLLIAQREGKGISLAALVPLGAVVPIWTRQRDISAELIQARALGGRRKNHAMNGHSPTLWLQDDRGGERVAEALWTYPGVIDLGGADVAAIDVPGSEDVQEPAQYVEGATRRISVNAYERDRRARRACIAHHGAVCSVCGFQFGDTYGPVAEGHIHVHHVRPLAKAGGEYKVDPIEDLRPVCANCHAVIHLGGESRSLEQVRAMLKTVRRRPA